MKMCQSHWETLKEAIRTRGIFHRVADNGQEAMKRLVSELDGTAKPGTYDPLMDAHNAISARALELGGLYLLTGEYCPLCELEKHGGKAQEWIDGASDSAKRYCEEHSLQG